MKHLKTSVGRINSRGAKSEGMSEAEKSNSPRRKRDRGGQNERAV